MDKFRWLREMPAETVEEVEDEEEMEDVEWSLGPIDDARRLLRMAAFGDSGNGIPPLTPIVALFSMGPVWEICINDFRALSS